MRNFLLRLTPVLAAAAMAVTMAAGTASAATASHPARHSGKAKMANSQTMHRRGEAKAAHTHARRNMGGHSWSYGQPPVHGCPAQFFCEWPAPNWPGNPPFKVWACGINYPAPFSGATQVGSWVNNQVPRQSGPRVNITFKTGNFVTNPPVTQSRRFLWRGQLSVRIC